jgi:flagellar protein FliS
MSAEKFQQYQNQQIMTASPAMLVFMLYEKAIGCLKEAIKSIESGEIERRWKANKKAMEIIDHMRVTLDFEAGGEIAANLDGIYSYLLRELPNVDLKNDPAPARDGIKLLEPLCDSWRQIADQGEAATTQAAQAAENKATAGYGAATQQSPAPSRATQPHDGPGNANANKASDPKPPVGVTIDA